MCNYIEASGWIISALGYMSHTIIHNRANHIIDTCNITLLSGGAVSWSLTLPVVCHQDSSDYLHVALFQMSNSTDVSHVSDLETSLARACDVTSAASYRNTICASCDRFSAAVSRRCSARPGRSLCPNKQAFPSNQIILKKRRQSLS